MIARLRNIWVSRAPRERKIISVMAAVLVIALYAWVVQSVGQAGLRLRASGMTLQAQAIRLDRQAAELGRLRNAPVLSVSQTNLRTLVQDHAGAAGLSRALVSIDAPNPDQVVMVFGAVAFADWLKWIDGLKSQHVSIEACRIEALSTPGLVSVTATLVRAGSR
jgi:type II secretory pathway component PulM